MTATDSPSQRLEERVTDGARVVFGVGGLIAIALGAFVLFAPKTTSGVALTVLAALIGTYAVVSGLVYLGSAIFSRSIGGWARVGNILLGLLYLVGGIVILSNLLQAGVITAIIISIMIGIIWIFEGVVAFMHLKESPSKAWTVIYGILSIIAGGVLCFSPLMGAVTLWWLLGISMVVLGLVQVVRAFKIGK